MYSICAIGREGLRSGIQQDEKIKEDGIKVTGTRGEGKKGWKRNS